MIGDIFEWIGTAISTLFLVLIALFIVNRALFLYLFLTTKGNMMETSSIIILIILALLMMAFFMPFLPFFLNGEAQNEEDDLNDDESFLDKLDIF